MASFPLTVQYCGVCGLAPELCSYDAKKYPQCRPWLEKHAPQHVVEGLGAAVAALALGGEAEGGGGGGGGGSGAATAGGAAAAAAPAAAAEAKPKAAEKKAPKPKVTVVVRDEGKRQLTAIGGLEPYCAKLKEAASALAKKVGAGATVRPSPSNPNNSEVVVQVRKFGAASFVTCSLFFYLRPDFSHPLPLFFLLLYVAPRRRRAIFPARWATSSWRSLRSLSRLFPTFRDSI